MERVEDIELCRITDVKVKEKVMFLLIRHRVPYAERWDEVPFLKRSRYHGAKASQRSGRDHTGYG